MLALPVATDCQGAKTAGMAMLHRTVQKGLVSTGPPSVSARTVLAARAMGWTLAKPSSQPGMLWIDVNAKIAKTGKRGLASSVRAEQPLHGAHRDPQVSR